MISLKPVFVAVLALGLLSGCDDVGQVYRPTTGGYLGTDISPKRTWLVTGELLDVTSAADSDFTTSARSDYEYSGATLTVDLRRVCLFQTVILEHGASEHGHPRKLAVATSIDGKTYTLRHTAPGKRRVTILSLPEPVLARYVRLRVVQPGPRPWNVAEIYLQ